MTGEVKVSTFSVFQAEVRNWMTACFGRGIAEDRKERNFRFLEEALELVQACDIEQEDVLKLVEYVFQRPVGEKGQEVGGVMITLAALCDAQDIQLHREAIVELNRIWGKIGEIRAKQASKAIKYGPLP